MRPELADALQEQADMALRHACSEGEARWVGLLLWVGANPRTGGLAIDEFDDPTYTSDPDSRRSALQAACSSGRLAVVKQLKPDPERDDMTDLLRSIYFLPSPDLLTHLLKLGASPNDKANGGSSVLDKALMYLNFGQWSDPYGSTRVVPSSKTEAAITSVQLLIDHGARWRPEGRTIADVRRTLYQLRPDAIAMVINLVRPACDESVFQELTRTPKMQAVLRAERRRHAEGQQRAARSEARREAAQQRARGSAPIPAPAIPARYGAYNRERLYEQVWTEPTQEVAKRYGVSDVMIAKACRMLRVPKPPRGSWAKKAAGQTLPPRPPLPK